MITLLKVFQQELDQNGDPLVGGKIYVYNHDTLDLATIYNASGVAISNPVVLGSSGRTSIYIGDGLYDATLVSTADVTLQSATGISGAGGGDTRTHGYYGTIEELRAVAVDSPSGVPDIANISGYYSYNDGKAIKQYWYDPDATDLDGYEENGGTVIKPLSDPASGRWMAVLDDSPLTFENFGAVGNGSTDDLVACNATIDWVCRFVNSTFNGGKIVLKSMYAISDELQIDNYGVCIEGERFIIPDGPSKYGATCGFKYIGPLDATKSCLKVLKNTPSRNTGCFTAENLHFDSNDLCGFGMYLEGSGRGAIAETTYNNRGAYLKNLSYVGYIKAGQVIGSYLADDLEDPNAAQFENISIENLRFSGGSLIDDTNLTAISNLVSIGLFVNAGNLEFGICNNLYFDPPATRAHKHHVWQRLGGLILNGIVTTRAGSAGVVYGRTATAEETARTAYIGNITASDKIPWAIVSYDQMIINGWRMEDRWAFKQAGTTFNAPSEIRNVVQRPDAEDAPSEGDYVLMTAPTDAVWDCQGYDSSIKLINITTNASVAIGSSNDSIGEADIIFSRSGGALTVSGANQYGKYVDAYRGDYKYMGNKPSLNYTDEDNNQVFAMDRGNTHFLRSNPTQLTANKNDLYVGFGSIIRLTSDADRDITGICKGLTHSFAYDAEAGGPFTVGEVLSWTGGTGLLAGLTDGGATGTIYIQLLSGVKPSDNLTVTGGTSSATCAVNGYVTAESIATEGRWVILANVNSSAYTINLKHSVAGSQDTNRILCSGDTDVKLYPNDLAMLFWDVSSNKWRASLITSPYRVPLVVDANPGAGNIYRTSVSGVVINGVNGSLYALSLRDNGGSDCLVMPQGTDRFESLTQIGFSSQDVTASTTQTQGQSTLTKSTNYVITVANANDVVTLPSAYAGAWIYIRNLGANTLQIFPSSGDQIDAIAVNGSTTLASGAYVTYRARNTTNWYLAT